MHSMKNESQILLGSPGFLKALFLASRPKTWMAGISPVLIGTFLAQKQGSISYKIFILTLLFSLFIQIGTNFANDYFDFLKGADEQRVGPKRATQEGWIKPFTMLKATFISFAFALFIALPLMIQAGPWSFFLACLCILFGVLYTGGPKPLGYLGLGELLVFSFFGPFAVLGTYYLQKEMVPLALWVAGLAPGCFSSAILVANNLRDGPTDKEVGKKTLVVRFGKTFGKFEYLGFILLGSFVPFLLVFFFDYPLPCLFASLSLFVSFFPLKKVFTFQSAQEAMPILAQTSFVLFFYTLLFCIFV